VGASFFIPKRINVGFQERSGTYTGKLAYIIYFDEKGKLRKETSWNSWRHKSIPNEIFENEPTSGFVLNKKVGDYVSDWNHRQAYVRVYDPRDFEFEITIQNLLYILENATSTKGKGLEGDFVYGWDGKDLVLIPTEAPDYVELVKLNALRHSEKKIGARDLKIGATYRTRQNDEWIYMGKFDEYTYGSVKSKKPSFWFAERSKSDNIYFQQIKSVSQKLVEVISDECVEDYAEIFDKMECNSTYSPIDESKTVFIPLTFEEFEEKYESSHRWTYVFTNFGDKDREMEKQNVGKNHNDKYYYYKREWEEREYGYGWNRKKEKYKKDVVHYVDTLQDIFDIVQPHKKIKYLANGKLYGEVTY
jgi:hypothetical protein